MESPKEETKPTSQNRVISPVCNNLLLICYFIAIFDLVQALYFLVQATALLVLNVNLYSIMALLGSIFWIIMVVLLIVGLWSGRPQCVVCWLIFSMIGIIIDIFFFMWTISISDYIQWSQIVQFTLLYFGIVVEWLCVFIVYKYCLKMDSDTDEEEPPSGSAGSNDSNKNNDELKPIYQPGERRTVTNLPRRSKIPDQIERGSKRASKLRTLDEQDKPIELRKSKDREILNQPNGQQGRVSDSRKQRERANSIGAPKEPDNSNKRDSKQ